MMNLDKRKYYTIGEQNGVMKALPKCSDSGQKQATQPRAQEL